MPSKVNGKTRNVKIPILSYLNQGSMEKLKMAIILAA